MDQEQGRRSMAELAAGYRAGLFSVSDVIEDYYRRIGEENGSLNAYLALDREAALERAAALDERFAGGDEMDPLAGIPLAIKDNICVRGTRTTCASRMLENYLPPYDATVISRLRRREAIFLGKTNLDEFAFGSSTESSAFGPTKNPVDPGRVPGGSSGGSAAAVAAGLAAAALGSDTGGSIRQPASFCGVVGLKPTYGRVSRYGLVAFASSLDQVGPITADVMDAARLLEAIAGFDERDATSSALEVPDYPALASRDPGKLKIGLPREYFGEGLDPAVSLVTAPAVAFLEKNGFEVREVDLPHTRYAIATYYVVSSAEAGANLARFDGVRYGHRSPGVGSVRELYEESREDGFGTEVKRRIIMGTFVLSAGYYDAYYLKAQKVRTLIRRDFENAFREVDVLLAPTSPTPAFRFGEKISDPIRVYLSDVYTASANLAGIPALSLPAGRTGEGLPVGLQLMGPAFREDRILALGRCLEKEYRPAA